MKSTIKIAVVDGGKYQYGLEVGIDVSANIADIIKALDEKIAYIIATRDMAGPQHGRYWCTINGEKMGRKAMVFNSGNVHKVQLTPEFRSEWYHKVAGWLKVSRERAFAKLGDVVKEIKSLPKIDTFTIGDKEYKVEEEAGKYFFRTVVKCSAKIGEHAVCGCDIPGTRRLSISKDGSLQHPQQFIPDDSRAVLARKGGQKYHCPEHAVKVMTPEEFFLGKSADVAEEHGKKRLSKEYCAGLESRIRGYKQAEDQFVKEIETLENTVRTLTGQLINVKTAQDLVDHLQESLDNMAKEGKLSDAQIGMLYRIIKTSEEFIKTNSKGGK